jgi:hypothetical protein
MAQDDLAACRAALTDEAVHLAGGLGDLSRRATVYHHLFRASGGNHVFPLIAAHGALWAGGYFRFALRLGRGLSWQYPHSARLRQTQLERLDQFANALREINRRVCVDTYVGFHLTFRFGSHSALPDFVAPELIDALARVHWARRTGHALSDRERQQVFNAHFQHEQDHVVGPAVQQAASELAWPLVRFIALRPSIRFAYFPANQRFWFRDFSCREERIEKGLAAFDLAASAGWSVVEDALRSYRVLPDAFFLDPVRYFSRLRHSGLAPTRT